MKTINIDFNQNIIQVVGIDSITRHWLALHLITMGLINNYGILVYIVNRNNLPYLTPYCEKNNKT